MRRFLPLSISVGLLVVSIIGGSILTSDMEVAAQTAGTPTPESEEPGYTNYSGYYRMRCWPACHSKDFPESMQSQSQSKPGYTVAVAVEAWLHQLFGILPHALLAGLPFQRLSRIYEGLLKHTREVEVGQQVACWLYWCSIVVQGQHWWPGLVSLYCKQ